MDCGSVVNELAWGADNYDSFVDTTGDYPGTKNLLFVPARKGNFPITATDNWGGGDCENDYQTSVTVACSGFQYYLHATFNTPGQFPQLPVGPFRLTGTMADATRTALIDGILVTQNWTAYYGLCAPTSCSYTVQVYPTKTQLATVVLGIIGGLSPTAKTVVDKLVGASWTQIKKRFGSSKMESSVEMATVHVPNPLN